MGAHRGEVVNVITDLAMNPESATVDTKDMVARVTSESILTSIMYGY